MDLMQLEMFVATVEEGNFRRAADRVFRTQPAVSMALKKLQDEIGASLFERSGRNSSAPSEAGNLLYEYAKKMLHLREEAKDSLSRLTAGEANRIRIGASDDAALHILPLLVLGFRQQYPNARIEICHEGSVRLIQGLKDFGLDLALTSLRPDEPGMEATSLVADEMVVVGWPEHPLARGKSVSPSELARHSFIVNTQEPLWQAPLTEKLKASQLRLQAGIEATNLQSIKDLVLAGLGLAVMPFVAVREEVRSGELALIHLDGFRQEHSLWMVSRTVDSNRLEIRAVRRLVEAIVQKLNKSAILPNAQLSAPLMANR